jgi:hypothetical protein
MMKTLAARAFIDAPHARSRGAGAWLCHDARGKPAADPARALILSTHVALLAWRR